MDSFGDEEDSLENMDGKFLNFMTKNVYGRFLIHQLFVISRPVDVHLSPRMNVPRNHTLVLHSRNLGFRRKTLESPGIFKDF